MKAKITAKKKKVKAKITAKKKKKAKVKITAKKKKQTKANITEKKKKKAKPMIFVPFNLGAVSGHYFGFLGI